MLEIPRLSVADLNIDDKHRGNPLPWKGQFSPQFVEAHLRAYARAGDAVLDPFVGSGTILGEARRLGLTSIGFDVNPAAVMLARVYTLVGCGSEVVRRLEPRIQGEDLLDVLSSYAPDTPEHVVVTALIVASDLRPDRVPARWALLRALVEDLPEVGVAPQVAMANAQALPVGDGTIDLVFTSPPYINVINYHQQHRTAVEALGWRVLSIARSEIGANRKFRSNRFLTVTQYCLDMALSLSEIRRVLRDGGRAVFVVGRESRVCGVPFNNALLIEHLAAMSFDLVLRQERVFTNRYGIRIWEDIFHFRPGARICDDVIPMARQITTKVLWDARDRASAKALSDLEHAIARVGVTPPSPLS